MAAKKSALDAEIERLYRGPLDAFTSARNDLVKQLRKSGGKEDAERVRTLAKPTPSAWAVNVLFERETEKMEGLLAAGERAREGQRKAVSGKGVEALRESLGEVRALIDELRRRGSAILAESGRAVSRDVIERIGTDLQALALNPDAAEEVSRHWLDHDLDPPGFEVLAGLQLAGAPVVDLAARRAEREERDEKKAPERKLHMVPAPKKPAKETALADEARQRQETVERARREREEERTRRRIEVAEEKAERARKEAESLRGEAETAEKAASEARRHAEAADQAAGRAREKADRAAERLARAEAEVKEAKGGR
jgi:hypothetical protein